MLTLNILKYQTKNLMYDMSLVNVMFLIKGSHLSTFKNVQSSMVIFLFFLFFQVLSDYIGVGGSRIHVKCYFTAKKLENQNTGD